MALTELQLPTREVFYGRLQSAANQMNQLMHQWRDLAEFISMIAIPDDLDAMVPPVATGQVRTDLGNFRTAIEEILDLYDGNPVTPTNNPSAVIDKIRSM
jgi:hypothetical protein